MATKEEQIILSRAEEINIKLRQKQLEEKKEEKKRRKLQQEQEEKKQQMLNEEKKQKEALLFEKKVAIFTDKLPDYLDKIKAFDDEIKNLEMQCSVLKGKKQQLKETFEKICVHNYGPEYHVNYGRRHDCKYCGYYEYTYEFSY